MTEYSLVPNSQFAAGSFSQVHVCVRDGVKYAAKIYDKNCLTRKSNRLKRAGADAATAVKNELATIQLLKESGCTGVLCHEDILETEEELMIVFKMCRPILIPQPGAEERFECVWMFRDARPSEDVVEGYIPDRWRGICEPSVNTYITPAGGQLTLQQVANVMRSVCSAVSAMHCLGICHRDIKIENVLQLGDQILLADFSHCVKTSECTTGGTGAFPLYSPQEARGEAFSAEMADVWQLGVLFYVLLFGCLPVDCVGVGTLLEKLRALPDNFPPPPPNRCRWDGRLAEGDQWVELLNGMLRVNEMRNSNLKSALMTVDALPFWKLLLPLVSPEVEPEPIVQCVEHCAAQGTVHHPSSLAGTIALLVNVAGNGPLLEAARRSQRHELADVLASSAPDLPLSALHHAEQLADLIVQAIKQSQLEKVLRCPVAGALMKLQDSGCPLCTPLSMAILAHIWDKTFAELCEKNPLEGALREDLFSQCPDFQRIAIALHQGASAVLGHALREGSPETFWIECAMFLASNRLELDCPFDFQMWMIDKITQGKPIYGSFKFLQYLSFKLRRDVLSAWHFPPLNPTFAHSMLVLIHNATMNCTGSDMLTLKSELMAIFKEIRTDCVRQFPQLGSALNRLNFEMEVMLPAQEETVATELSDVRRLLDEVYHRTISVEAFLGEVVKREPKFQALVLKSIYEHFAPFMGDSGDPAVTAELIGMWLQNKILVDASVEFIVVNITDMMAVGRPSTKLFVLQVFRHFPEILIQCPALLRRISVDTYYQRGVPEFWTQCTQAVNKLNQGFDSIRFVKTADLPLAYASLPAAPSAAAMMNIEEENDPVQARVPSGFAAALVYEPHPAKYPLSCPSFVVDMSSNIQIKSSYALGQVPMGIPPTHQDLENLDAAKLERIEQSLGGVAVILNHQLLLSRISGAHDAEQVTTLVCNHVDASNVRQKIGSVVKRFKASNCTTAEHGAAFAFYLIRDRVAKEKNLHDVYADLIYLTAAALPSLRLGTAVIYTLCDCINVALKFADKLRDYSNYRLYLKNMSHFLGRMTIARGTWPVPKLALDPQTLLVSGMDRGHLSVLLPIVTQLLLSTVDAPEGSPVHLRSAWTVSLLALMKELRLTPNIKQPRCFEVELLFKHLNIAVNDVDEGIQNPLRGRTPHVNDFNTSEQSRSASTGAKKGQTSLFNTLTSFVNTAPGNPRPAPRPDGNYYDMESQQLIQQQLAYKMQQERNAQQPDQHKAHEQMSDQFSPEDVKALLAALNNKPVARPPPQHSPAIQQLLQGLTSMNGQQNFQPPGRPPAGFQRATPQASLLQQLQQNLQQQHQLNLQTPYFPQQKWSENRDFLPMAAALAELDTTQNPGRVQALQAYAARNIVVAPTLSLFQLQPQLKAAVSVVLLKACKDVWRNVSDRICKTSTVSTAAITRVDFAYDPDETNLRYASRRMAVTLVAYHVGGMCRDVIKVTATQHLRSLLHPYVSVIRHDNTTSAKAFLDQMVQVIVLENFEFLLSLLQVACIEKAIYLTDRYLDSAVLKRRAYRMSRCQRPFLDEEAILPSYVSARNIVEARLKSNNRIKSLYQNFQPVMAVSIFDFYQDEDAVGRRMMAYYDSPLSNAESYPIPPNDVLVLGYKQGVRSDQTGQLAYRVPSKNDPSSILAAADHMINAIKSVVKNLALHTPCAPVADNVAPARSLVIVPPPKVCASPGLVILASLGPVCVELMTHISMLKELVVVADDEHVTMAVVGKCVKILTNAFCHAEAKTCFLAGADTAGVFLEAVIAVLGEIESGKFKGVCRRVLLDECFDKIDFNIDNWTHSDMPSLNFKEVNSNIIPSTGVDAVPPNVQAVASHCLQFLEADVSPQATEFQGKPLPAAWSATIDKTCVSWLARDIITGLVRYELLTPTDVDGAVVKLLSSGTLDSTRVDIALAIVTYLVKDTSLLTPEQLPQTWRILTSTVSKKECSFLTKASVTERCFRFPSSGSAVQTVKEALENLIRDPRPAADDVPQVLRISDVFKASTSEVTWVRLAAPLPAPALPSQDMCDALDKWIGPAWIDLAGKKVGKVSLGYWKVIVQTVIVLGALDTTEAAEAFFAWCLDHVFQVYERRLEDTAVQDDGLSLFYSCDAYVELSIMIFKTVHEKRQFPLPCLDIAMNCVARRLHAAYRDDMQDVDPRPYYRIFNLFSLEFISMTKFVQSIQGSIGFLWMMLEVSPIRLPHFARAWIQLVGNPELVTKLLCHSFGRFPFVLCLRRLMIFLTEFEDIPTALLLDFFSFFDQLSFDHPAFMSEYALFLLVDLPDNKYFRLRTRLLCSCPSPPPVTYNIALCNDLPPTSNHYIFQFGVKAPELRSVSRRLLELEDADIWTPEMLTEKKALYAKLVGDFAVKEFSMFTEYYVTSLVITLDELVHDGEWSIKVRSSPLQKAIVSSHDDWARNSIPILDTTEGRFLHEFFKACHDDAKRVLLRCLVYLCRLPGRQTATIGRVIVALYRTLFDEAQACHEAQAPSLFSDLMVVLMEPLLVATDNNVATDKESHIVWGAATIFNQLVQEIGPVFWQAPCVSKTPAIGAVHAAIFPEAAATRV